ncbi:hypothetical protein [Kitasatospora viridis]|uniref:Uncharacterized protein n=1 Tax=Kitasatospora viridis TaxID=281105 RepID=A0A561UH62_9ACTN|nr:hypothetical protein [Kitasatospora viridis]TWF98693.1 hypothetical protein FHX73_112514 [Kitasatospora viridis]
MTPAGADEWSRRAAEVAALRASGRWLRGPSTGLAVLERGAEEEAHERYLAFLLDPWGAHGLGAGPLAALLRRAGRPDLAADAAVLAEAVVEPLPAPRERRPGLVVVAPRFTLAVELRLRPGAAGQRWPAREFGHLPDPVLVQLTPSGRPTLSAAVRPVSLLDLARDLSAALAAPARAGGAREGRGRAVALDYLNALEDLLGMNPVDEPAARFWLTHVQEMTAARRAARELLAGLPERSHAVLDELASRLGEGLTVEWVEYESGDGTPHVAVLLGRVEWLAPGGPRCGFGLGQRLGPGADPDDPDAAPFVGFYCEDDRLREAVSAHFDRRPHGRHWARRALLPLRPEPRLPVLDGLARRVAESVAMGWREDGEVMERLRAAVSGGNEGS